MSAFSGDKQPLSYPDALVEMAVRIAWPTEQHRTDVVKALQLEHGVYVVPEAESKAAELERLRRLAEQRREAQAAADVDAELAALRAELGEPEPGTVTGSEPGEPEPGEKG